MIVVHGQETTVSAWVKTLTPVMRTRFTVAGQTQWYVTLLLRVSRITHPVRILVLWASADATEPRKILLTNRTYWEAHRILKVDKRRWTGTETFHRDGTQHLGMGACQLRDGMGQTRHIHLVVLAYTALIRQLPHGRVRDWAHTRLMTSSEACRSIARETLGQTIAWTLDRAREGMSLPEIKRLLTLP